MPASRLPRHLLILYNLHPQLNASLKKPHCCGNQHEIFHRDANDLQQREQSRSHTSSMTARSNTFTLNQFGYIRDGTRIVCGRLSCTSLFLSTFDFGTTMLQLGLGRTVCDAQPASRRSPWRKSTHEESARCAPAILAVVRS
ncbi:hypothetical protein HGRIS_008083 [Hohenbuehelia grisea]|uniref:Uncharacterized protein n=1 Tax=Hohenbuehelia grisea TaxID=104357 RepID=A0ABR3J8A0_9AGAR